MDQVVEVRNLIKDHTIECLHQKAPSYIQPFLCEPVDENIILLYKKLVPRNITNEAGISVPDYSVDLDLTGSPLEYSFGPGDYYDDTIINGPMKKWLKDEESHGSVSVIKARKILSLCNLQAQCWQVPAWIVCDGSDYQRSVLLSTFRDAKSGWATRSIVCLLGHWSYKQAEEYALKVRKEHLSRIPGCEMKTFMTHVYDIQKSMGSYENSAQCSLRLSWSSSSFFASPPAYADTMAEMVIVVDQPTSAAYKLWNQLKLLHHLVVLLAASNVKLKSNCLELPMLECNDGSSVRTETADVLNLMHNTDYTAMKHLGATDSTEEPETVMQLNMLVQQAVSSKVTLYLDFTHHLFSLLANCRDSENLAKCLLLVFQEVQSGNVKLFVHPKNPTKVAHILRELMRGNSSLPELSGIGSVKLLMEIGLEKLSMDYTHIFLSSDLAATLEQLKLPSHNVNELNDLYKKLDVLGRLHVTLEILLLAESQMKFSLSSLQPLAAFTLNNIETQVESFSTLLEGGCIKFQAPVATKEVQCLLTRRYSSSRMQLTSEGDKYKVHTILHCSALPVFPFVPQNFSDSQLSNENNIHDEDLHCSQLTSFSNKLL